MAKDKSTPEPTKPQAGVLVNDLGDGTTAIHGIEPNGTEHQITIGSNHGVLASFKAVLTDWLQRVGERGLTWDRQVPYAGPPGPAQPSRVEPTPVVESEVENERGPPGERGPKGAKGDRGAEGPQGIPGPPAETTDDAKS